MISASRVGPLVVAVAASALLVAGPAYAADAKPPVDTPACTAAVQMLRVGENTGTLDTQLEQTAHFFARERREEVRLS